MRKIIDKDSTLDLILSRFIDLSLLLLLQRVDPLLGNDSETNNKTVRC
jgi:hypothetical protein